MGTLEICYKGRRKSATIFAAVKNLFSEQTIESGHQRRVGDALFEGQVDVADADFAAPPGFVENLPLEFSQRQPGNFAGPAKSPQKEFRRLHRRVLSHGLS